MKFIKKLFILVIIFSSITYCYSATLKKCEGVSTSSGYKYVGTYCVDYQCKYIITRIFDEYCPYRIDE